MIIVPIEENHSGLASATDAKFRTPDMSDSGLEALGAGLAKLGDGGQQFATALDEKRRRELAAEIAAAHLDDHHQRNLDDAAAKKAYVDYSDQSAAMLHGENGILNHAGAEAHAAFPTLVAALADAHDEAMAPLDSVQRAIVGPALGERLRSDVARAAAHVRQQGEVEQQVQSRALQTVAARDAVAHAEQPDLHDHHMATGENAIRQQAMIGGTPDDERDQQLADYRSGVHADTIEALAARDPASAADWYAKFGGDLNEADRSRAETSLNPLAAKYLEGSHFGSAGLAGESNTAANPLSGVDLGQTTEGYANVLDAAASARASSNGTLIAHDDTHDSNDRYANLRSLVDRYPGSGTLLDANFVSDKAGDTPAIKKAHRALADRWRQMNQQQRLEDPELAMPAKALDAVRTQLLNFDPKLRGAVGTAASPAGTYVAEQILWQLEHKVLPSKIAGGYRFPIASDEALRPGGRSFAYLLGEVRDAASYALNARQKIAWKFFTSGEHPFTNEQAAGLIAALTLENNLDPDKWQNFKQGPLSGYGIAQWNKERRQNFANLMGKPLTGTSFEEQLAYVKYELEKGAYRHFGQQLHQQSDAYQAGFLTTKIYEAPDPRHREETSAYRGNYARQVLQEFAGH